jgi:hypothetical protein
MYAADVAPQNVVRETGAPRHFNSVAIGGEPDSLSTARYDEPALVRRRRCKSHGVAFRERLREADWIEGACQIRLSLLGRRSRPSAKIRERTDRFERQSASAQVVANADDFVNVSRGHAAHSLAWTKVVMGKLGLTVNEAKTSVRDLTVLLGSEVPESS